MITEINQLTMYIHAMLSNLKKEKKYWSKKNNAKMIQHTLIRVETYKDVLEFIEEEL